MEITRIKYINHVSPDGYKIRISKKVFTTNTNRTIRIFVDETNKLFWIQDIISLEFLAKGSGTSKQMLYINAREALASLGIYIKTGQAKKGVVRRIKKLKDPNYINQLSMIAEAEGSSNE